MVDPPIDEPVVTLPLGRVRGPPLPRGLVGFAGVPYAAPPVGARRFRAPEPPDPWDGERDATRFGPFSWQGRGGIDALLGWADPVCDEDCLTLNVTTPACDDAGRPVMVWIHGGGFTTGSGALSWYDAGSFVRRGDVVVVTVNYRLGALGFLHLGSIEGGDAFPTSGLNGILDQVAALRWVRDHIAAFGGDPGNVTVFGESAGGMSVATLMALPEARGLFHRAIAQSGAAHNTLPAHVAAEVTSSFFAALGIVDLDDLVDAEPADLLDAQARVVAAVMADPGHLGGRGGLALAMPFQPVAGGPLPDDPLRAIHDGSAAEVSLLVGATLDEWNLFHLMSPGGIDDPRLLARLDRMVGPHVQGGGRTVADTYRVARPGASADDVWCAVLTDWTFRVPAVRLAEAQVAHQPAHTFMYRFSWASRAFDGRLGSCHALDVPFTWNALDKPGASIFLGDGPVPHALAEAMHDAWWHFARTGDPNHGELPVWPTYDLAARPTMDFGDTVEVVHDPGAAERELWTGIR
jgi:para-nitrobenzyl esterase